MASSQVPGIIERINAGGSMHAIASTAYGYCDTAANVAIKDVAMTGFNLITGVTVHVQFQYENTAVNP